jgi:hypothetical protein
MIDSPCVDLGSDFAIDLDLYKHTTRTDGVVDGQDPNIPSDVIVDMGYHYIRSSILEGDFDFDDDVDERDLMLFFADDPNNWVTFNCQFPDFCHGRDLNQDGIVNFLDYSIFSNNYDPCDMTPPNPNPMAWDIPPDANGTDKIYMKAVMAFDNGSGTRVEYNFECFENGVFLTESGWGENRSWEHTGLGNGDYCYRVAARDTSQNLNYTEFSLEGCVTLGGGGPGVPASPTGLTATAVSSTQINLSWNDNSNDESNFEIERKTGAGTFTLIDTTNPNVNSYPDTGLDAETAYTYRVRAINAAGDSSWSNEASATTLPAGQTEDDEPPLPDPSTWATLPAEALNPITSSYWHTMTATVASDALTGGNDPVEYYFSCLDTSTFDSGWQLSQNYTVEISSFPKRYKWRFRTRDQMGNVTQWSPVVYVSQGGGG